MRFDSALAEPEGPRRTAAVTAWMTVVSLEDLLVDRLGCWAHWQSSVDGVNAWRLLRTRSGEFDMDCLHQRAEQAGFVPALSSLLELDERYPSEEPPAALLEEWARVRP